MHPLLQITLSVVHFAHALDPSLHPHLARRLLEGRVEGRRKGGGAGKNDATGKTTPGLVATLIPDKHVAERGREGRGGRREGGT